MNIKLLFTWLGGLWATGIGLRFIITYFNKDLYVYNSGMFTTSIPPLFDLCFDWGPLFLFGVILVLISTYEFIKEQKGKLWKIS